MSAHSAEQQRESRRSRLASGGLLRLFGFSLVRSGHGARTAFYAEARLGAQGRTAGGAISARTA